MTPMRKRIAERLIQAQQTAALLTTFNEVDMTAVMELRNQYKDSFQKKYDIKLGFMSFFTKASIDALKQFPAVNAEIRGADIIYKDHYDIGIAVGTGKGLVVPVLRNAGRMSFAEVEKAIAGFGQKIKDNKLSLEDLQGRYVHDHQRRDLRFVAFHADRKPTTIRGAWHARDPTPTRGGNQGWQGNYRSASDDVCGVDVRSPID